MPGAVTIAEESTAWPACRGPPGSAAWAFRLQVEHGQDGNDTLAYVHRTRAPAVAHHRLTFGLVYAFSENFVLPLSHDEVVHGKARCLSKMPGDDWRRFANLRAYLSFMWTQPGKKLLFMGGEIGHGASGTTTASSTGGCSATPPPVRCTAGLAGAGRRPEPPVRRAARAAPARLRGAGFEWIDCADSAQRMIVIAWLRIGADASERAMVVCNFTPVRARATARRALRRILDRAAQQRRGRVRRQRHRNLGGVRAERSPRTGGRGRCRLTLPPLAALVLRPEGRETGRAAPGRAGVSGPNGIGAPGRSARTWTATRQRPRSGPRHATCIELCVFDAAGERELSRHALPVRTGDIRHGGLAGAGPGLVYGLRAHGPYSAPRRPPLQSEQAAARSARARAGRRVIPLGRRGARLPGGAPRRLRLVRTRATARRSCRSAASPRRGRAATPTAAEARPPWGRDGALRAARQGLHRDAHRASRPSGCGTVEAARAPRVDRALKRLGVTAVELLRSAAWLDELHLARRGLSNYWGYNPIAFLRDPAVARRTARPRGDARCGRRAARGGHRGILDVVFTHTGEGDERGPHCRCAASTTRRTTCPTASARRLPQPLRLRQHARRMAPRGRALIVDALRVWAGEVGVDASASTSPRRVGGGGEHGRLRPAAAVAARGARGPGARGLQARRRGLGLRGWFVGGFPPGWSEWNDRYRDDVRALARPRARRGRALATRLAGRADLFGAHGRGPGASIDFVTAHDGFTLADAVSYAHRRNHANGEDNRDGHAHEVADGSRAERPDDDPVVRRRRAARRPRDAGDADAVARGADAARPATSSERPSTATTTPTARTARRPGCAGPRGRTGRPRTPATRPARTCAGWSARSRGCAPRGRAPARRGVPQRRAVPLREGLADVAWLREDGEPMHAHDWHDAAAARSRCGSTPRAASPGAPHDRVWIGFASADGPTRFVAAAVLSRTAGHGCSTPPCRAPRSTSTHRASWSSTAPRSWSAPPARSRGPSAPLAPRRARCAAGARRRPTAELEMVLAAAGPADRGVVRHRADAEAMRVRVDAATLRARRRPARFDGIALARRRVRLPHALAPGAYTVPLAPAAGQRGPAAVGAPRLRHAWAHPRAATCHGRSRARPAPGSCRCSSTGCRPARTGASATSRTSPSWAARRRGSARGAAGLPRCTRPRLGWPDRGSPYSPSSRVALNPLYVSLPRAARAFPAPLFDAWAAREDTRAAIAAVRAAPVVDYPAVFRAQARRPQSGSGATSARPRATRAHPRGRPPLRGLARGRAAAAARGTCCSRPSPTSAAWPNRRAWPRASSTSRHRCGAGVSSASNRERVRFHAFGSGSPSGNGRRPATRCARAGRHRSGRSPTSRSAPMPRARGHLVAAGDRRRRLRDRARRPTPSPPRARAGPAALGAGRARRGRPRALRRADARDDGPAPAACGSTT